MCGQKVTLGGRVLGGSPPRCIRSWEEHTKKKTKRRAKCKATSGEQPRYRTSPLGCSTTVYLARISKYPGERCPWSSRYSVGRGQEKKETVQFQPLFRASWQSVSQEKFSCSVCRPKVVSWQILNILGAVFRVGGNQDEERKGNDTENQYVVETFYSFDCTITTPWNSTASSSQDSRRANTEDHPGGWKGAREESDTVCWVAIWFPWDREEDKEMGSKIGRQKAWPS